MTIVELETALLSVGANLVEFYDNCGPTPDLLGSTPGDILENAFTWEISPEGYEYWQDIWHKLEEKYGENS